MTTINSSTTLTPTATAPASSVAGAASAAQGVSSSNPLAALAALGSAPTRGVAATQAFQQTLAAALSSVLSNIKLSGSGSGDDDESSNIVPNFTSQLMPLQIQLALNAASRSLQAAQPSTSQTAVAPDQNGGASPA